MQVTIEGTPTEVRAQILELAEMMRAEHQITIDGDPVSDKIMAGMLEQAEKRTTDQSSATPPRAVQRTSATLVIAIDNEGIKTVGGVNPGDRRSAWIASTWYSVLRDPCMELMESGRAEVEFVERLVKTRAKSLIDLGWSAVELRSPGPGTQGWTTLIDLREAGVD
jgi:hypothetical protein